MQGIVTLPNGRYVFRDDHGYEPSIWAWNIHADSGSHVMVQKWPKLPGRDVWVVELFDLDRPPATVSYQPLLED